MATTAAHLARELGTDERAVRRAISVGAIRGVRPSGRRLVISDDERRYLRSHWSLVRRLRDVLRTEPGVRAAVLFGSAARGDDRDGSDIDLLVSLRDSDWQRRAGLTTRLERGLGRSVDLVDLQRVRDRRPALLISALRDGRAVVDRDGAWAAIQAESELLARDAAALDDAERRETSQLLEQLLG